MEYTEEQIKQQAGSFRLLAQRVSQYFNMQEQFPESIRDSDEESAEALVGILSAILDENSDCLMKGEVSK